MNASYNEEELEERMRAIGQNGNDGIHYDFENESPYANCSEIEVVNPVEIKPNDRKRQPVYSGVLKYFPLALKEVSKCSLAGNEQHHADKPLHWDKTKSFDNEDALVRHLIDHSINPEDTDGILHLSKVAWRALAALEIYLEKQ